VFRRKPVDAFVTETPLEAEGIVSGETGAAGLGGLLWLLREESSGQQREQQEEARRALNVNRESRILLFNGEGATDPHAYDRLVGGRTLTADKSQGSRYLS
jgi:diaminopropionate ammonia-lyase